MTSSHHETSDIHLAAYLLSQGATFVRCERVGLRRNKFFFVADAKLHELLRLYWMNVPMTLVPAHLFAALRRLKSLVRLRSEMGRGAQNPMHADATMDDESELRSELFPASPC